MAILKSILNSVPVEILREIASSADAASQKAAPCRVSQLFNVITIPVLYRHISLDSVERMLEFFDALTENPKRHDHIRSLRIVIQACHGPPPAALPRESSPAHPRLRRLILIIFATLSLPNLRTFSTYHTGAYSPLLASFINRHPLLTHLDLIRPWVKRLAEVPKGPPLLQLPRLRVYRGCAVYAALLVVSHNGLARAEIWDAPPSTDLDALLHAHAVDGPLHGVVACAQSIIQEIADALDQFVGLTSFDFDNVVGAGPGGGAEGHSRAADFAALTVEHALPHACDGPAALPHLVALRREVGPREVIVTIDIYGDLADERIFLLKLKDLVGWPENTCT
ncbi:hypothetical protein B0H19DRAFT_1312953 [Mycena capillaripes]|nr:hypothetical protein B0H19DRAFT_1312953 [Mycena capillaripes]